MAQSALRALVAQLGTAQGPAPSGMASWQGAVQNAPQRKPEGQQIADVLGGVALPMSAVPFVGDVAGLAADAAMYANYPEERTPLNYALSALGVLPFVPSAAGIRAGKDAADAATDSFQLYHGTPHVIGPSQRVVDVGTGKEFVESPDMVSAAMAAKPGQYEVVGENPLGMFDINRVGTGEGAQAYGHGIYATEQPDIGRGYRDSLAKRHGVDDVATIGKRPITDVYSEIETKAARLSPSAAEREYQKLELIEQVMLDNDVLGVMQRKDNYAPEVYEWFEKTVAPNFNRPGALYELQVNAPQARFLDWDKRIADQSPEVQKALEAAGVYDPALESKIELLQNQRSLLAADRDPVTNMMRDEKKWHKLSQEIEQLRKKQPANMTGQQAYYMAAPNATNQAEASKALNKLGIPGIKYLDAFSRTGDGVGTLNYVLFDPKIADITGKYGIAGSAVGLSALRGIQRDDQQRQPD
jgi:hypothetical protein